MKFSLVSNIFAPHVIGGYELGCQSIAEELVDRGYEVEILTSEVVGQLKTAAEPAHLKIHRIFEPVYEYDEISQRRNLSGAEGQSRRQAAFGGIIPGNALALARALEESQPDVIWIFNPLALGPIGILEAALTQPAKCLIHLMDHLDGVIADHQDHLHLLPRFQRVKRSFHAISCSRKILTSNEAIGPYRSHRVIYNGVDFGALRETEPDFSGPLRLVYFGQISAAKGVLDLLKGLAAAKARQPRASIQLDLIGRVPNSFEEQLRAYAQHTQAADQIRFLGYRTRQELLSQLPGYDAAIMLLSDTEPFAYAPLEAAEAGLPVILTSGIGLRECFPEQYPLTIWDRSDQQEVAEVILWCASHRRDLPGMGKALRETLRRHCDLKAEVMPAYLRTIRHISPNPVRHSLEGLLASYYSMRALAQGTS